MDTASAYKIARQARSRGHGIDSSKLRGSAASQVHAEGVLVVEKYHQPVAYLASVELFEQLLLGAEHHTQMVQDLPLAATLLTTALKLGISPEQAIQALVVVEGDSAALSLSGLASLLEEAADDLDAAAVARERLTSPEEHDVSLDDFAAELGMDISAARTRVREGRSTARIER